MQDNDFEEAATMTHTTYTFTTKNGHRYTAKGNNPYDAQMNVELAWHISLKGATWTEYYKLRAVRTGKAY